MGALDDQQQIAAARVEWQPDDVIVARCGDCKSIIMSAVVPPCEGYLEENWDLYVEQSAGIEAIAETLAFVSTGPGADMLDVGCGYGFGLDVGERLRGWKGTGLDPSPIAAAGRAALGIDIRTGLLDAEFAPEERFDVIFASELFEHLPDTASVPRARPSILSKTGCWCSPRQTPRSSTRLRRSQRSNPHSRSGTTRS